MSFLIAAPASGSGKTTVTLGLLRALTRRGRDVSGAKSGPDYIDPHFHAAACRRACVNLDAWAMTPERIRSLAACGTPLIVEAAMGLFDGAANGAGSAADLAKILNIPVILVVDAGRMSQSVGAVVHGFTNYDPDISIAGIILNNVGSDRHEQLLRDALQEIPVIGAMPRSSSLNHPSRHLGLVQAQERPDLEAFLDRAADLIDAHLDLDALPSLGELSFGSQTVLPPPAQRIAVAQDAAFAFSYPHQLADWQRAGASIATFSPLADDPVPAAEFVYLPGGYPELHARSLAGNKTFLDSLRSTAQNADIYGECGGYMVLGETLIDADGQAHQMAGLLPLVTSFADRKRHLGYRVLNAARGKFAGAWHGHEFHYATTVAAKGEPLFTASDATGEALEPMGLVADRVSGSFAHLIDRVT